MKTQQRKSQMIALLSQNVAPELQNCYHLFSNKKLHALLKVITEINGNSNTYFQFTDNQLVTLVEKRRLN